MKTLTLGIALLVVATAFVAFAPAAEARGVCSDKIDDDCRSTLCNGEDFCTSDLNPVCVMEPCPRPIP